MRDYEAREQAGANLEEMAPGRKRYGRSLSTEDAGEGWYEDLEEVRALARVLYEGEALIGATAILEFFDCPQDFSELRDEWVKAGEPDVWPRLRR